MSDEEPVLGLPPDTFIEVLTEEPPHRQFEGWSLDAPGARTRLTIGGIVQVSKIFRYMIVRAEFVKGELGPVVRAYARRLAAP